MSVGLAIHVVDRLLQNLHGNVLIGYMQTCTSGQLGGAALDPVGDAFCSGWVSGVVSSVGHVWWQPPILQALWCCLSRAVCCSCPRVAMPPGLGVRGRRGGHLKKGRMNLLSLLWDNHAMYAGTGLCSQALCCCHESSRPACPWKSGREATFGDTGSLLADCSCFPCQSILLMSYASIRFTHYPSMCELTPWSKKLCNLTSGLTMHYQGLYCKLMLLERT